MRGFALFFSTRQMHFIYAKISQGQIPSSSVFAIFPEKLNIAQISKASFPVASSGTADSKEVCLFQRKTMVSPPQSGSPSHPNRVEIALALGWPVLQQLPPASETQKAGNRPFQVCLGRQPHQRPPQRFGNSSLTGQSRGGLLSSAQCGAQYQVVCLSLCCGSAAPLPPRCIIGTQCLAHSPSAVSEHPQGAGWGLIVPPPPKGSTRPLFITYVLRCMICMERDMMLSNC